MAGPAAAGIAPAATTVDRPGGGSGRAAPARLAAAEEQQGLGVGRRLLDPQLDVLHKAARLARHLLRVGASSTNSAQPTMSHPLARLQTACKHPAPSKLIDRWWACGGEELQACGAASPRQAEHPAPRLRRHRPSCAQHPPFGSPAGTRSSCPRPRGSPGGCRAVQAGWAELGRAARIPGRGGDLPSHRTGGSSTAAWPAAQKKPAPRASLTSPVYTLWQATSTRLRR